MTNKILSFAVFFLIVFKIVAIYFTEFSLYGDEAQYWLWSQTLDLGYYSKPPLLAWFLGGYSILFGDSFVSLKIFPILIYFFISYAIYKLCLNLSFDKKKAKLCALSFLIIPATSLSSFLISTDLLLLLFWATSMVLLLKVIKTNLTINFFLLGLVLGLGFLAKYAAIYFLLSLLLLLFLDRTSLKSFRNNPLGVLVFLLSLIVVLLPNILWNFTNGWITFSHTSDNANLQNLNLNLYEPIKFFGSQILMVGPVLFIFFIFFLKNFRLDYENRFLLIFSLPIILIVLIESFLVRANANWAAPALISVFIILFRLVNKGSLLKINFIFNYLITFFLFFSILITSENKVFDRITGVGKFSNNLSDIIKDKDIVISDRIIFSNIAYQLRKKENLIFMPYEMNAPITNHFQMSSALNIDRKNDFFLLGDLSNISYLSNKKKNKLIKEFDVPFSSEPLKLYEIYFK
ncbi:glycosyltransferase family 39 protein [Alphaproteobacteria bacterium]|nr:glycosyltransferase family 39 protein [Alphaproteobacteria bacterium]